MPAQVERTVRVSFSAAIAFASALVCLWSYLWIASTHLATVDSLFVLESGVLAAVVFAYRAKDATERWPLSILRER